MAVYASLRINCSNEKVAELNSVLAVEANYLNDGWGWGYEIVVQEDENVDYITSLIDIINNKQTDLKKKGVVEGDIELWILKEESFNWNFEIPYEKLKILGDMGVSLCVSTF